VSVVSAARVSEADDDVLPDTASLGAGGGIGFAGARGVGGGRVSFGWGGPSGAISLGYRGLFGRTTSQHQGELLLTRYLSPESATSLYAGGGLAIGAIARDGRVGSGPGVVLAAGVETHRFGSVRPAFGVRADFLGAHGEAEGDRFVVGGGFTAEASLTVGSASSGADADYVAPKEYVPSDSERAWLARFFVRGGADLVTSTEGSGPDAGLVHVGIGSSALSFEGGMRLANVSRARYLTQLELEGRAFFSPRAAHSPFFALGFAYTYADLHRSDSYAYSDKGFPGVLGEFGVQFFRRETVRLDLSVRGDAVALERTSASGDKANAGFMGVASIGLGIEIGGVNSGARDQKPGPFEGPARVSVARLSSSRGASGLPRNDHRAFAPAREGEAAARRTLGLCLADCELRARTEDP
jgi:hypothetical protein